MVRAVHCYMRLFVRNWRVGKFHRCYRIAEKGTLRNWIALVYQTGNAPGIKPGVISRHQLLLLLCIPADFILYKRCNIVIRCRL